MGTDGTALTTFKYPWAKAYYSKKQAIQLAKECGLPDNKWIIGDATLPKGQQVFIDNEGGEHFLKH